MEVDEQGKNPEPEPPGDYDIFSLSNLTTGPPKLVLPIPNLNTFSQLADF